MLDQVENVIIACQGDDVTRGEKDKDAAGILYRKIRQYVMADRFNIDFSEEIRKRKHIGKKLEELIWRNDWGPFYEAERKKCHSGEYDDTRIINDIKKSDVMKRIDDNFRKNF